jgi:capsular exopolysaccharide synthesis family protein
MAGNLVLVSDPTSPAADAYRRLRVNLMAAGQEAPLQVLLVAAAGPDPDKSGTVANLAIAFARVDKRVILVDCDLRHPALHTLLGLPNDAGVTSVLDGDVAAGLPLQPTEIPNLSVLTSGPPVQAPSDSIASPAMAGLIARLRQEADLVLFDAPPVVLATDAMELATQVDGVLLTVSAGRTKRDDAQRAVHLLKRVGARLVGTALVNLPVDADQRRYLAAAP